MSIRRIAKALGLSPAAVSMALRNSPKISEPTKRRVLRAARRLGYRPDPKIAGLMSQVRLSGTSGTEACLGVVSFYDTPRPWERSVHLTQMHGAMVRRAAMLGYRLEPLWLRAPGMTYRRMRLILQARGIQGLLCFGSPNIDEDFPAELAPCAVVTQGLSVKTPLHRVVNDAYGDTRRVLDRVYELGYRRPGLVLGRYEDVRGGHANLSAYFGWCQQMLGTPAVIPILTVDRLEEEALVDWLRRNLPDVLVVVHVHEVLSDLMGILRKLKADRMLQDVGVVALSQVLGRTGLSGIEENERLMGEWAVELLVSRIMVHDFDLPSHPRVEMVEGDWVEGRTLRPQQFR
jgi:LacI family transcriptional regulator